MPSNIWNFSDFVQTKKIELVDSRATLTTFQPKLEKKTTLKKFPIFQEMKFSDTKL